MSEQTILTFIITDPKDVTFTGHVYQSRNFLNIAQPIILHEFNHFYTIFRSAGEDFRFRVVVHAGLMDSGGVMIGEHIFEEFRSKPELKNLDIYFVTRKPDWFKEDQFFIDRDGHRYYNLKYFNRQDFIEDFLKTIPVYRKGDLVVSNSTQDSLPSATTAGEVQDQGKDVDFTIITALYDDESTAFIENSKEDKNYKSPMGNVLKLTFREDDDSTEDYREPFYLSHAQKMGMVDSTYNAAMLLENYNPKFLIMAGVCGGKEGKKEADKEPTGLKYRDVIIANNIADVQTGKLEKGKFIPYLMSEAANHELITFIEQKKDEIKKRMYLLCDKRDKAFVKHVQDVVIRIGDYGCGSRVINTTNYFKKEISSRNNKAIALEMESYGIYRTCTLHNTLDRKRPTLPLVVKSVMDYTDENKTDEYKTDAAKMSYLCIRAMMPLLCEFHKRRINA